MTSFEDKVRRLPAGHSVMTYERNAGSNACEFKTDDLQKFVAVTLGALRAIACFNDEGASIALKETGSYSLFDEPGSAAVAREALALLDLSEPQEGKHES